MRTFYLAAAIVMGLVGSASAIDFTAVLTNEYGQAFTTCTKMDEVASPPRCIEAVPLTIGKMIYDALNIPDATLSAEGIIIRGMLAMKIRDAKNLDLDAKQRDLIKAVLVSAVNKLGYRNVTVVQVLRVVDPAAVKDE